MFPLLFVGLLLDRLFGLEPGFHSEVLALLQVFQQAQVRSPIQIRLVYGVPGEVGVVGVGVDQPEPLTVPVSGGLRRLGPEDRGLGVEKRVGARAGMGVHGEAFGLISNERTRLIRLKIENSGICILYMRNEAKNGQ
ncbi:unnamed protein product [Bursaphelenchus xylophilus]|uniref:(pine wood nematode) hypothetical protein n=1 Tax=Bursaphelenchus xylophilus TaxID=6326 RepID=A0A811KYJ2_BURXY|nr:unnamed protein product [Bursaphelenchus xylophilus]CAG9106473.1 unnamed protein product [Bursaphelenchus xylophilus]